MAPLRLPPEKNFKRKYGFHEPGRKVLQKLHGPLQTMGKNMHIHINPKTGKPGACTEPTGDAVALMIGYTEEECLHFALGELVANVFDASHLCLCDAEMSPVACEERLGKGIQCVLCNEGVCGFVPTQAGLIMWNLGTPFDESALIKGGNGPKATTRDGTGGFNFGLKQSANCLLALGIKPSIQFVGYDSTDLKASTMYTWVRKPPKRIAGAFKQNPKQRSTFECNVPIVMTSTATVPGENGIDPAQQHEAMARALSTFERVYTFDATAGATVVLADGAALVHRACYTPRVPSFAGHPLALPEGPLVLVGERFYKVTLSGRGAHTWRDGLANLVVKCPGKGMPGMPYRAFVDEKRVVTNTLATDLLARIVQNVLCLEADPCAEEPVGRDERTRRSLANQLMPLLKGGVSDLFGAARGAALEALIKHPDVSDTQLRNLLLGRALEPQRVQLELSREAMRAHIANSPIVHSGNVLRATYLASLCGTLAYKVEPSKVHRTLITTTNLDAAEERAAEAIWSGDEREEPVAELARLLEHLYGNNAEFALLPMPSNATLHGAARAFRFDDDEHGVHRLVLHKRATALDQVREACALARPGTDEVARAQRVLDVRSQVFVQGGFFEEGAGAEPFFLAILKELGIVDENGAPVESAESDNEPAEDDAAEPPNDAPLSVPSEAGSDRGNDSDDDSDNEAELPGLPDPTPDPTLDPQERLKFLREVEVMRDERRAHCQAGSSLVEGIDMERYGTTCLSDEVLTRRLTILGSDRTPPQPGTTLKELVGYFKPILTTKAYRGRFTVQVMRSCRLVVTDDGQMLVTPNDEFKSMLPTKISRDRVMERAKRGCKPATADDDDDDERLFVAPNPVVRTEAPVQRLPRPPPPPPGGFEDTVDFHTDLAHGRCVRHPSNTIKPARVATDEPNLTSTNQICVEPQRGLRIFAQMSPAIDLESIRSDPMWLIRLRAFNDARDDVARTVGFGTAKIYPSWSPDGNWTGYADSSTKSVFINLTKLSPTLGYNVETILHERAHIDVGCEHGHSQAWWERLHDLTAAYIDCVRARQPLWRE